MSENEPSVQSFSISAVLDRALPPKPETICHTNASYADSLEIVSGSIGIILNRDLIKAVHASTEAAIRIAQTYPERQVLLCNTYAGVQLLHDSITAALKHAGISPDTLGANEQLANLHVLECPYDSLTVERLEEQLATFDADDIIINSFEFCRFTSRDRQLLAAGLLKLQRARAFSLTVFSHEVRKDLVPQAAGRGALGMLSAVAVSVELWGEPIRVHAQRRSPEALIYDNEPVTMTRALPHSPARRNLHEVQTTRRISRSNRRDSIGHDSNGQDSNSRDRARSPYIVTQ